MYGIEFKNGVAARRLCLIAGANPHDEQVMSASRSEWARGWNHEDASQARNAATGAIVTSSVPVTDDAWARYPGNDADLLGQAVRVARDPAKRGGEEHPRWVAVMAVFSLGSGYSKALCRRFGLDPEQMVHR